MTSHERTLDPIDVLLESIVRDDSTQSRVELDDSTVDEYAELLTDDADFNFPPVSLFRQPRIAHFFIGDGHHRVHAYLKAGRKTIPAVIHSGDKRQALMHSIVANQHHGLQRSRADKRKCVELMLGDDEWAQMSDRSIAEQCGVSNTLVSQVRREMEQQEGPATVNLDSSSPGQKRIGRDGKSRTVKPPDPGPENDDEPAAEAEPAPADYITLDQWEDLTGERRHEVLRTTGDKTFNRQTTASIEWAQWSWNPITGCKHNCPYCYARDIAIRLYPQRFDPSIVPSRLTAPQNMVVPATADEDVAYRNVFTGSMADMFGRWVPPDWITAVLKQCVDAPQWNFLMLTKFPQRVHEFGDLPENVWMGTTVDCQNRVANAEDAFAKMGGGIKWLSVEPMLTQLTFSRLDLFDWVVIGGASRSTQTPEWIPPIDWIVDVHQQARAAGCRVYYKTNLKLPDELRIKEFPWGDATSQRELPKQLNYLQ